MIALTEERKRLVIEEQPGGLWLVLAEENPQDTQTAGDLLCGDLDLQKLRQPKEASGYAVASFSRALG